VYFASFIVDLLGLLNWASHPEVLKDSLEALMKVDGEEIVKFLQDVLDALFNILMQNSDSELYDNMVFECLVSKHKTPQSYVAVKRN
jgi:dedicator of cytokinesis protein 1